MCDRQEFFKYQHTYYINNSYMFNLCLLFSMTKAHHEKGNVTKKGQKEAFTQMQRKSVTQGGQND